MATICEFFKIWTGLNESLPYYGNVYLGNFKKYIFPCDGGFNFPGVLIKGLIGSVVSGKW